MALKDVHETLEEIPEQYRELYTEKNGQWECTGIEGLKTSADFARLNSAHDLEKKQHKATKEKLAPWLELDLDVTKVQENLHRLPELEAAAKDKLDDAKIEEIVQRRVDGTIKSRTAPLEAQLKSVTRERDEFKTENEGWVGKDRRRTVRSEIRKAATAAKVRPEAIEDILLIGENIHELTDDGKIITKENVGVTPGLDPAGWLTDVQDAKSYWWPESAGGGARGGKGGRGLAGGKNPWSAENWNVTEQGKIIQQHGEEKAGQLARAAGSDLNAIRPPAKKTA